MRTKIMGYSGEVLGYSQGMLAFGLVDGAKFIAAPVVAVALGGALKSHVVAHPGDGIVRTFRGQPVRTKGRREGEPYGFYTRGHHYFFPFWGGFDKVSFLTKTNPLEPITIDAPDAQIDVRATITWYIQNTAEDAYKALYVMQGAKELEQHVVSTASDAIRKVAIGLSVSELNEHENIFKEVAPLCVDRLSEVGVALEGLALVSAARTHADVLASALRDTDNRKLGTQVLNAIGDASTSQ